MRRALPAEARAFEPISSMDTEEARRRTQDAALAGLGSCHLEEFNEGDEVWVQNRVTGAWDRDAAVLGKHNGGASFSLFFPDTEQLLRQNERFLRLKKSVGETPKSDEQRRIASEVSHFPPQIVFPRHSTPTTLVAVSGSSRRRTR